MYINLYTTKQLHELKARMLWLGLFLSSGGAASFLYNVLLIERTRWYWAGAAFVILAVGLLLVAAGTDKVKLKNAYFSISPSNISYRLNFYSSEYVIDWRHISAVQLCDSGVLFNLHSGRQPVLHFSLFQSYNIACHVGTSIQLAALERNISVNGVLFNVPNSVVQRGAVI